MVVHPFVELLSAGEHPIGIPGTIPNGEKYKQNDQRWSTFFAGGGSEL